MVPEQGGEQGGCERVAPGGRIYATVRRVASTPTRPVRARSTPEDLGSRVSERAATTTRRGQVVLNPPRSGAQERVPAARHEYVARSARPVTVAWSLSHRSMAPRLNAPRRPSPQRRHDVAAVCSGPSIAHRSGAPWTRLGDLAATGRDLRRSHLVEDSIAPLGREPLVRGAASPVTRRMPATMAGRVETEVAVLLGTTREHRGSASWRSPPARPTSQLRQPRWRTSGRSTS